MSWVTTEDIEVFREAAGGFLRERPVENSLPLTIVATLRRRGGAAFGGTAPMFGWWRSPDGAATAAFVETPPRPAVIVASSREVVESLALTLARLRRPLSGINAVDEFTGVFADVWQQATGAASEVALRNRLYRLEELDPPSPWPAGAARLAGEEDRELLLSWYAAFERAMGNPPSDLASIVDDRLGYGGLMLWCVDGAPVSMAGVTRPEAGAVRIFPVYTPDELRGRGYAGAVTAAISEAAKAGGVDEVVLFTDLDNPATNALYQRLGFRPILDRTILAFRTRS